MGQFIEVLNNQANLDDLNLNLDIQGGLDCNVDEVSFINHRMSINHFLSLLFTFCATLVEGERKKIYILFFPPTLFLLLKGNKA